MKRLNSLKSVGAVAAGLLAVIVTSYATDAVLEATGVLPRGGLPLYGSELLIVGIVVYRSAFSVLGCYVAARLAPHHPMRHASALGGLGFLIGIGGIAANTVMPDLGPIWYPWTLLALTPLCTWLGGTLATARDRVAPALAA